MFYILETFCSKRQKMHVDNVILNVAYSYIFAFVIYYLDVLSHFLLIVFLIFCFKVAIHAVWQILNFILNLLNILLIILQRDSYKLVGYLDLYNLSTLFANVIFKSSQNCCVFFVYLSFDSIEIEWKAWNGKKD